MNDSVLNAFLNQAPVLPDAWHVAVTNENDVEKRRSLIKARIVE